MILRTSTVAALLAATTGAAAAFRCHPPALLPTTTTSRSSANVAPLRMSSIPDDDDARTPVDLSALVKNALPPAPEDTIALGGDVVALFVYSYLDHYVNDLYLQTAAESSNVADLVASAAETTFEGNPASLPVWFDPNDLAEHGHVWLAAGAIEAPYAPAIAHGGLAFVALATSWIAVGAFTGAFLHENTLECDATGALNVTLKTWAGTCVLMVALALASDAAWGTLDGINALSSPARGGLTRADADFIFDSLTVLAFWRFMFNYLLGYRR